MTIYNEESEKRKVKRYDWPDTNIANGSGIATHSSKLIALSIKTLGEVLIDMHETMKDISDSLRMINR